MALTLLFQLRATATIPGWGRVLRLDVGPPLKFGAGVTKKLTFHSTRRQAINQPALRQQEDNRDRNGGEHRRGAKSPHR